MSSMRDLLSTLAVLLLVYDHASCLIIPEEVPTILSLIYSNIPPIKKGTDSRVGVGFRLGEHADFQVLVELGPQTETDPIGTDASKRRRDAMFYAAMRGELGPLAQAIAKYQIERRLQKELQKLEVQQKNNTENSGDKKSAASEWLSQWSKDMVKSSEKQALLEDVSIEKGSLTSSSKNAIRIGRPFESSGEKSTISDLRQLYKQSEKKNE